MTTGNDVAVARRPPLAKVAIALLAVALIAWLALRWNQGDGSTGGGGATATKAATNAGIVSPARLQAAAASGHQPIYWAQRIPGRKLELSRTPAGVYLRYLPRDAKAGDPRATFLTIGSYPIANAYAETKRVGEEAGAWIRRLPHHGIAVSRASRPTSVYVSYPGSPVQVEVYDPDAAQARQLVLTGRVRAVRR
jgi:hypothetical protein